MWYPTCYSNELYHHGILGQKWGIRRFQNPDGSLTAAGRKRYGANSVEEISSAKGMKNRLNDLDKAMARNTRQIKDNTKKANNGDEQAKLKIADAEKYIGQGRKETESILKNAKLSGYDINAKETVRFTDKGVQTVIAYAALANGGVIGGAIGGAALMYKSEKGTKYKVKEGKYKYDYDKNPDGSTDVGVSRKDGKPMGSIEADRQQAEVRKRFEKANKTKVSGGYGSKSYKDYAASRNNYEDALKGRNGLRKSDASKYKEEMEQKKSKINPEQLNKAQADLEAQRKKTEEEWEKLRKMSR